MHYYWVIVTFVLITSTCIVDICQYSFCTFNVKQELYKNYQFFTDGGAHNSGDMAKICFSSKLI